MWQIPACLAVAVAFAAVYRVRNRNRRLAGLVLVGLFLVFAALSTAIAVRWVVLEPPGYDPSPERALGRIAAEEVARRAQSRRIVVIGHSASDPRSFPVTRIKTEAFLDAARRAGLTVVAQVPPTGPFDRDPEEIDAGEEAGTDYYPPDAGRDAASILYAMETYPDVGVIVCLDGVPVRDADPIPGLEGRQIMAIDWHSSGGWAPALEAGLVDMVIAFRRRLGPAPEARRPSYRDIFEQRFLVLTARNARDWDGEVLIVTADPDDDGGGGEDGE